VVHGVNVCGCEVPWKTQENVAGDDTSKDRESRRRENPGDKLQRTRHATPRRAAPRRRASQAAVTTDIAALNRMIRRVEHARRTARAAPMWTLRDRISNALPRRHCITHGQ